MKVLTVGEFKTKFSEVIDHISKGNEVTVTYGKKKEKIAIVGPYSKYIKKGKRKLGIWEGKASFKLAKDFKMTEEEFLNS